MMGIEGWFGGIMGNRMVKCLGALLLLAWYPVVALADYKLNLQIPATALGERIYDLHTWITVICIVIFIGVFGAMFYAVFKHRKSVGHPAAHFHENTVVEVIWTLVPCVILIGMAIPATGAVARAIPRSPIDGQATGYQWKGLRPLPGRG
jgi:cytochrome c oxidase subunit 2